MNLDMIFYITFGSIFGGNDLGLIHKSHHITQHSINFPQYFIFHLSPTIAYLFFCNLSYHNFFYSLLPLNLNLV